MSPLLGSAGGSSEYAFRGTLDDWPVAFASSLAAQDITGADPGTTRTATLTVTGINYKARVTVEYPNTTVSINGGSPVLATELEPPVFVRDNDIITINFQIPLIGVSSFNTLHGITVKIGKRTGFWTVRTRAIDATPNSFSFTNQSDLELNTLVTSNEIIVGGLEPNFNFDLSVTSGVDYYKNGVLSTASTIANGDTLYLETISPSTFSTLRTYTVNIGGISALGITGGISSSWTITTRSGDSIPDAFTFTDILEANQLNAEYTSNPITISGIDAGPLGDDPYDPFADVTAIPVSGSGPTSLFEIRKSDDTLRYPNPNPLTPTEYYQSWSITNPESGRPTTTFAYLGDKITLRVNSSPFYSTTASGGLVLGYFPGVAGDTWSITTRPTPINTIPNTFSFTGLSLQNRGTDIFSNTITLSGMTSGDFGSATIASSTAGINPRFQVVRGGTIVKSYTAAEPFNVQNGDEITLRMTTPNPPGGDGAGTYTMNFEVSGTNTQTDDVDRDGFSTISGSTSANWTVETKARTCPINISYNGGGTSFTDVNLATLNTEYKQTFTPSSFESDCNMDATLSATGTGTNYNFTGVGNPIVGITSTKTLNSITPGVPIEITVRSGPDFLNVVTASVSIGNTGVGNPATPDNFLTSDTWTITNQGDDTPAEILTFTRDPAAAEVNSSVTLAWTTAGVISFRSASWTTATLALNGSSTATLPSTVPPSGTVTYTISFYANPFASNYDTITNSDVGGKYIIGQVTVTVNEDLSAIFTPTNFTDITADAEIIGGPARVASDEITVTGITAAITATNDQATTTSKLGGVATYTSGTKTLLSDDSISIQIPNNSTYLGPGGNQATSTGSITFSNGNGTKTFTVTANLCESLNSAATVFPSGGGSNTISYRQKVSNVNWGNGSGSGYLYIKPTPLTGTFGDYILSLPAFAGLTVPSFDPLGTTPLTPVSWADAISAAFQLWNQEFWVESTDTGTPTLLGYFRNPTLNELTNTTNGIFRNFGEYLITSRSAGTPILNITELKDAYIRSNSGERPLALRAVSRSLNSLNPPGSAQTGNVFDSCNNPIPLTP